VRKALASQDWQTLEQLARESKVKAQPTSSLINAALGLPPEMRASRPDLLRSVQRAYPGDLWANHNLGHELSEQGRPEEAVRYFTAALALRPGNPGISLNRGWAIQSAGQLDAAIAAFHEAIRAKNDFAEAHNNLGLTLMDRDQFDQAVAECRAATRIRPDFPEARTNLGSACDTAAGSTRPFWKEVADTLAKARAVIPPPKRPIGT
jgi:tetratricopeptide (TPR) repeat protein